MVCNRLQISLSSLEISIMSFTVHFHKVKDAGSYQVGCAIQEQQ